MLTIKKTAASKVALAEEAKSIGTRHFLRQKSYFKHLFCLSLTEKKASYTCHFKIVCVTERFLNETRVLFFNASYLMNGAS